MKRLSRFIAIYLIVLFAFAGLSASKNKVVAYWPSAPMGTVQISQTVYCDKTEIANVHWREYTYWLAKIFGQNSIEYKSALPDTTVWAAKDSCLAIFVKHYFRGPAYDFYPVVGITQKQVEGFSKWRADRVFERLLIANHVIEEDANQNAQTYFSIKKYFNGQYRNLKPDTSYRFYPYYRLPSYAEWKQALLYQDSIENLFKASCGTPYVAVEPCHEGPQKAKPTKPVNEECTVKDIAFHNLKGNVGEWTSAKNVSVGGGWADKASTLAVKDTFNLEGPNAWTGFRNVAEWMEFKNIK